MENYSKLPLHVPTCKEIEVDYSLFIDVNIEASAAVIKPPKKYCDITGYLVFNEIFLVVDSHSRLLIQILVLNYDTHQSKCISSYINTSLAKTSRNI